MQSDNIMNWPSHADVSNVSKISYHPMPEIIQYQNIGRRAEKLDKMILTETGRGFESKNSYCCSSKRLTEAMEINISQWPRIEGYFSLSDSRGRREILHSHNKVIPEMKSNNTLSSPPPESSTENNSQYSKRFETTDLNLAFQEAIVSYEKATACADFLEQKMQKQGSWKRFEDSGKSLSEKQRMSTEANVTFNFTWKDVDTVLQSNLLYSSGSLEDILDMNKMIELTADRGRLHNFDVEKSESMADKTHNEHETERARAFKPPQTGKTPLELSTVAAKYVHSIDRRPVSPLSKVTSEGNSLESELNMKERQRNEHVSRGKLTLRRNSVVGDEASSDVPHDVTSIPFQRVVSILRPSKLLPIPASGCSDNLRGSEDANSANVGVNSASIKEEIYDISSPSVASEESDDSVSEDDTVASQQIIRPRLSFENETECYSPSSSETESADKSFVEESYDQPGPSSHSTMNHTTMTSFESFEQHGLPNYSTLSHNTVVSPFKSYDQYGTSKQSPTTINNNVVPSFNSYDKPELLDLSTVSHKTRIPSFESYDRPGSSNKPTISQRTVLSPFEPYNRHDPSNHFVMNHNTSLSSFKVCDRDGLPSYRAINNNSTVSPIILNRAGECKPWHVKDQKNMQQLGPPPGISQAPGTVEKHSGDPQKSKKRRRIRKKPRIRPNHCLHLWEFLRDLLLSEEYCPKYIAWTRKERGEFRLIKTGAIANLWGQSKNRKMMTYEKMARAMRYYYKLKILEKVPHRKLHFRFGKDVLHKILPESEIDESYRSAK